MDIDEPKENHEVSPDVSAQGKENDEVRDLKAVELALAEKLLEVGQRLHDGQPVMVHDMNQIRTLWLTLERLQPEETETRLPDDAETMEIQDVDSNVWMTENMSEGEETVSTQWTENESENTDPKNSCNERLPMCEPTENLKSTNSKSAKLHTSQSYAFSKFTLRDMFVLFLRLQLEISQAMRKQQGIHIK